jgi:two-component system NtrC family response regulator
LTILIIDDDEAVRTSLTLLFRENGFTTLGAASPSEALKLIENNVPDALIMDMNYSRDTSGQDGLDLLTDVKKVAPLVPVILLTAWGSIELAVEGMRRGAADFITKPWDNQHLLQSIQTVINIARLPVSTGKSRKALEKRYNFSKLIGTDPAFIKILDQVGRISNTDASVLICGESGTGKELLAEAIHENSDRRNKPFIKVNLGGIAPTLFESEMFGHVKGAFTDAKFDRIGRFELADQGTIFLDEIGDLDLSCQVKLLRVLQDRSFETLGSSKTKNVNIRIISATNKDLEAMVADGKFREDLYYRINIIKTRLPALRERTGDIKYLTEYFISQLKKIYKKEKLSVSKKTLNWLQEMPWHGNIRELKNMVERTVLVTNHSVLEIEDFMEQMQKSTARSDSLPAVGTFTLDAMEKAMIEKTLLFYRNNLSKAARSLGLSRGTLYRRMEKHGIPVKQG